MRGVWFIKLVVSTFTYREQIKLRALEMFEIRHRCRAWMSITELGRRKKKNRSGGIVKRIISVKKSGKLETGTHHLGRGNASANRKRQASCEPSSKKRVGRAGGGPQAFWEKSVFMGRL